MPAEGDAFSKSVPDMPAAIQPPMHWRAIPSSPLNFYESPAGSPVGLFCVAFYRDVRALCVNPAQVVLRLRDRILVSAVVAAVTCAVIYGAIEGEVE